MRVRVHAVHRGTGALTILWAPLAYAGSVRRRLDLLTLGLGLAVSFATGVLSLWVSERHAGVVVWVHGAAGFAVIVLVWSKLGVIRRGLRRRWPRVGGSLLAAVCATGLLGAGLAHSAGVRDLGPLTALGWHITFALVLAPLVVWHLARRPVLPRAGRPHAGVVPASGGRDRSGGRREGRVRPRARRSPGGDGVAGAGRAGADAVAGQLTAAHQPGRVAAGRRRRAATAWPSSRGCPSTSGRAPWTAPAAGMRATAGAACSSPTCRFRARGYAEHPDRCATGCAPVEPGRRGAALVRPPGRRPARHRPRGARPARGAGAARPLVGEVGDGGAAEQPAAVVAVAVPAAVIRGQSPLDKRLELVTAPIRAPA